MTPSDPSPTAVDCRGCVQQLWDFLDGELTPARMQAITEHLQSCPGCFSHVDFERKFLAALQEARGSGTAPAAMRERIIASLRDAGFRTE